MCRSLPRFLAFTCLLLVPLGCSLVHPGFLRFQLINNTSHSVVHYVIARSAEELHTETNLLQGPIEPGDVFEAEALVGGEFWLKAVARVNGRDVEHTVGPVRKSGGTFAWAWYEEDGEVLAGAAPRDLYARTDLPAVVIDTHGAPVVDDPKVGAAMHVSENAEGALNRPLGEPLSYAGQAGIELRGNTSQTFPKKSFGVETWDEAGEGTDVELLGFPEEEDWVFYGPWMDRSLMRNVVGYGMWGSLGYYSPRTRYCELYLNTTNAPVVEDTYHGVYVLTEKIKRDKNRVNVSRLRPEQLSEPEITGGYILELQGPDELDPGALSIDVAGDFFVAIEDPDPEEIPQEQVDWITRYLQDFETALFGANFADPELGYAAYIDVDSWLDYILVQDFYKNRDGFRSSTWMSKDRGKKLAMGPVWDLNICFGYFSFNGFQEPEGWYLQTPKPDLGHSPWTDRLFQDPAFVEKYIARWKALRQGPLSDPSINIFIDAAAGELKTAQVRNFVRWDTLGRTLLPDIRFLMFLGPHPSSWQGEVEYLRNWISRRGAWIDANIEGLRAR